MRRRFFGQFLLSEGYITPPQLLAAVEYQRRWGARLGELAVALGMLTPFESEQVNAAQVREDQLFGEAAVRHGFLTERQLDDVLETQRSSRVLLGEALEKLGYLQRATVDSAHTVFEREELRATEGMALPAQLQAAPWAAPIFERASHLLRRLWDMPNKPGRVRVETTTLTLSDRNARAQFDCAARRELLVGIPDEMARRAGRRYCDELSAEEAIEDRAVQDFTRVLAESALTLLHERDKPVRLREVTLHGVRATLPPEERVVMVSFLTHLGQVLVGLTV